MATKRGVGNKPGPTVSLVILRDGVFVASDDKRMKGDRCEVAADIAEKIIGNGHGRAV
jgi:hypothetical protein